MNLFGERKFIHW